MIATALAKCQFFAKKHSWLFSGTIFARLISNYTIIIMKQHITTVAIAATSALCTMGIFSFKTTAPDEPSPINYVYKQITAVESVIPGGLGRSRLLTTDDGGQMIEKELKNFYSMVGINFGNIANNDEVIVDRINEYSKDGWELVQVTTATNQQSSGGSSSGGIFITRYMLRKLK
jgi:hypothetical protein